MLAARIFVVSFLIVLTGCASKKTLVDDLNELPPTAATGEMQLNTHVWTGVGGKPVRSLLINPQYPQSPTSIELITQLDFPDSRGDKYGQRIAGLLQAPETGDYQFWVSADESAEVWLSIDQTPINKRLIAYTNKPTSYLDWSRYGSQSSKIINLQAGEKYYFEVIHKEYTQADHLAVSWSGPGFSQQIMTDQHLKPMGEADQVSGESAFKEGYHTGYTAGSYLAQFDDTYPVPDSDGDGLPDFYELLVGLDPDDITDAYSDVDADLLTAYEEFQILTNPNNGDTDNDGISDGYEYVYGLDALNIADASLDMDGDGISNLDEFIAGTAADDQADFPEPVVVVSGPKMVSLSWQKPTTREDGSILPSTDISAYNIYYGSSKDSLSQIHQVTNPDTLNYSHEVPVGSSYFAISTSTKDGLEGARSGILTITLNADGSVVTSYDASSSGVSVVDSDGDGMSDAYETQYGFDPNDPSDASLDADGDGISNLNEFIAGTVPVIDAGGSSGSTPDSGPIVQEVSLSWNIPTQRADGSALPVSDIKSYKIYSGSSPTNLSAVTEITDPYQVAYSNQYTEGTYYFAISTMTTDGLEGQKSEVVSVSIQ